MRVPTESKGRRVVFPRVVLGYVVLGYVVLGYVVLGYVVLGCSPVLFEDRQCQPAAVRPRSTTTDQHCKGF